MIMIKAIFWIIILVHYKVLITGTATIVNSTHSFYTLVFSEGKPFNIKYVLLLYVSFVSKNKNADSA